MRNSLSKILIHRKIRSIFKNTHRITIFWVVALAVLSLTLSNATLQNWGVFNNNQYDIGNIVLYFVFPPFVFYTWSVLYSLSLLPTYFSNKITRRDYAYYQLQRKATDQEFYVINKVAKALKNCIEDSLKKIALLGPERFVEHIISSYQHEELTTECLGVNRYYLIWIDSRLPSFKMKIELKDPTSVLSWGLNDIEGSWILSFYEKKKIIHKSYISVDIPKRKSYLLHKLLIRNYRFKDGMQERWLW